MERKEEYYVVVTKKGETEGREIGAATKDKIVRVPHEFTDQGLAMLFPEKIAQVLAEKLQAFDDVEAAKVERVPEGTPPPPKEATDW